MGVTAQVVDGVLIVRYGERFATEEIIEAVAQAVRSPAFIAPMPILVDARASQEASSHAELRRRALAVAERPDMFGPRIAVVTGTPLQWGLSRQGGAYAENRGLEVRIFEDEAEAAAWARGG